MKILLFIEDALVRDQVRIGLSVCPDIDVVIPNDPRSFTRAESRTDWIWYQAITGESSEAIREIRSHNRKAQLMVLCDEEQHKDLIHWKDNLKITNFLNLPLDPQDFFQIVERIRNRRSTFTT